MATSGVMFMSLKSGDLVGMSTIDIGLIFGVFQELAILESRVILPYAFGFQCEHAGSELVSR